MFSSRSNFYGLIDAGRLPRVTLGRSRPSAGRMPSQDRSLAGPTGKAMVGCRQRDILQNRA
jgi:hypothetical protein